LLSSNECARDGSAPIAACRTINAIDVRTLDRQRDAAVTSLISALSCRSCWPNAPFAELVRLSRTSIADEMREERRRRVRAWPLEIQIGSRDVGTEFLLGVPKLSLFR